MNKPQFSLLLVPTVLRGNPYRCSPAYTPFAFPRWSVGNEPQISVLPVIFSMQSPDDEGAMQWKLALWM
ncbi:hypothetical protein [methane-oxidizing endosymbiont of Gigantopelta aegis]|uniref:hypothetical protein n=1 Tax=methane-oxidizing endosymbiont of Gigantopelta aegis TaxID=2794938 RepID=UPI0018DE4EB4|nr:hypothetical protein [methane-oxidizing endosymbiont of Gigantopelta aegis]